MMLRNFFFGNPVSTKALSDEEVVEEIEDGQVKNCFTEFLILDAPSINQIYKIDTTSVVALDQEKNATIWDSMTGSILFKLSGHTSIITCALVVGDLLYDPNTRDRFDHHTYTNVLLTGSTDQTIRIWDYTTGMCQRVIKDHNSTVKVSKTFLLKSYFSAIGGVKDRRKITLLAFSKCMCVLGKEPPLIVTCGADVCLWDGQFNLKAIYRRSSLDYIHTVVKVRDSRFVMATDSPSLVVFDVLIKADDTLILREVRRLDPHRQSITHLVSVSDGSFASASIDGTIVVWTAHRLEAVRKFNHHLEYTNIHDHTYPYSVHHLFVLHQNYLIVAIGCGFSIFDVTQDRTVVVQKHAHQGQVTCLTLVDDGRFLATSSFDGTIRLWGPNKGLVNKDRCKSQKGLSIAKLLGESISECKEIPKKLDLLGECKLHTNSVLEIVDCGPEGFVSRGSDDLVIMWKNSNTVRQQKDARLNQLVRGSNWLNH